MSEYDAYMYLNSHLSYPHVVLSSITDQSDYWDRRRCAFMFGEAFDQHVPIVTHVLVSDHSIHFEHIALSAYHVYWDVEQ